MKIKVTKDIKAGCEKGISIKEYKAGNVYEIYDDLAQVFLKQGWGVTLRNTNKKEKLKTDNVKANAKAEDSKKRKAILEAKIKNKAIKEAPENKTRGK
jgi:hypothetical protein